MIPADGYSEWTINPDVGKKDPWLLYLPEYRAYSFAGLWAHNDDLGVTSCTIITAPAVDHISHIHTRMPVILKPSHYEAWLAGSAQGDNAKRILLDNHLDDQMQFHRVSRDGTMAPTLRSRWSTRCSSPCEIRSNDNGLEGGCSFGRFNASKPNGQIT